MDRYQSLQFERAARDARIDRLPVKPRVVRLLQAVDRLALDAIAAGDPDALVDDGQVLAARLTLRALRETMRCSEDTVRRAVADAIATPFLDEDPEDGRASVLWLNWPAIMSAPPETTCRGSAAPPVAHCGGSHDDLRGVARRSAGGRTSKTPEKPDPVQHPPQFPRDREQDINNVRECFRDRDHGGGAEHADCGGSQPSATAAGADRAREYFDPELSDLLPWQRLEDGHLVTLEPVMLCVLFAEAVSRGWLRDTHDCRRKFLAIAYHCARHRRIPAGERVKYFVGRMRNRNARGLMDLAWMWSGEQLDAGGRMSAQLTAAVQAKAAAVR